MPKTNVAICGMPKGRPAPHIVDSCRPLGAAHFHSSWNIHGYGAARLSVSLFSSFRKLSKFWLEMTGSGVFLNFDTLSCKFELSSAFNAAASGDSLIYGPMLSCGMIQLPVADSPLEMAWVAFAGGTCGGIGLWKLSTNLEAGRCQALAIGRINRLVASGVNSTRITYTHE